MNRTKSLRIQFLLEQQINPKVLKKWSIKTKLKLDNLIRACGLKPHTISQHLYYKSYYMTCI